MVNFNILTGFIVGVIQFFFGLIKILLTYLSILCCIKCKDKCLNDDKDNKEIVISSPTPLLNNNHNHPILEAYEEKILTNIINNNNSDDNNNNKCNI